MISRPRLRIGAELAVARRLREQLLRLLDGELVGDDVLGHVRALAVALEVRAVATDAQHDPVAELDRVDLARVDRAEIRDELLQALAVVVLAEVEAVQPREPVLLARGDAVEVVLHARREAVVDEPAEVRLQQVDDREREKRRHERRALLEDVAAVEDRAEDRRVRRRPPDAELLERAHERRLRVARRRVRLVPLRLELLQLERVALAHVREAALLVVRVVRRRDPPRRRRGSRGT